MCIGFRRFGEDIAMMIGHKPNYYWIVCWVALTPLMVAVRRLLESLLRLLIHCIPQIGTPFAFFGKCEKKSY